MIQIFDYLVAGTMLIGFTYLCYGGYQLYRDKQEALEKRNDDKL